MKNYVALGDLVLDIYYHSTMDLAGYYAGGSAWNDLLNLSRLEPESKFFSIATCGDDWAGDFVLEILNSKGVDTTNVARINKLTKRFNIIVDAERTKSQLECPNCGEKIWYANSKLPSHIPDIFFALPQGVVVIDSLKKSVLGLAQSFNDNGWFLAADVGYINHLRYMSNDSIKALFCGMFGLLQINNRVYKFLLSKFSCRNEFELFELLNCRYLNITDGSNGSRFVYKDSLGNIDIKFSEAIHTQVVDPTGAGDAYFSMLLHLLDAQGNFTADIDTALKEASSYASKRVAVLGANGDYIKLAVPFGDCNICGNIVKNKTAKKSPQQKIATNTNHLLDRTLRALESKAAQRLQEILSSLHGRLLMVGTGGSFVAAEFAAKCVTQYHIDASAAACHPRDIIISGLNKVNGVILFSYSGKTKDIQIVYDLCQKESIPVYIITKYERINADGLYDENSIISYSASKSNTKERGFISMAGTLIPMCIFGEVYFPIINGTFKTFLSECFERRSHEFSSDIFFYHQLPSRRLTIDIFSGEDTICTAIDLESKFIESGLARVVIHEKKDFSHGRFNIIEKYKPDLLVFLDNVRGAYSEKLFRYLEKRDSLYICRLASDYGNIWGDLDLVIAAEFFSKYLSKTVDYDMAKPDYPEDAMTLYRYSRKDLR